MVENLQVAHDAWAAVYAHRASTLPDDHPDVQKVRLNLAMAKHGLGDSEGGLALEERVFEVRSRALPHDHPDLQIARVNLATTKYSLRDFRGALASDLMEAADPDTLWMAET